MLRQVEEILKQTPEVQTYSRRTGTGLGGGLSEANEGDFFVRLKPPPRRSIDEVMADVQGQIDQNVPGVSAEMAQLMEDMIGDMTAVPQPIEIKLYSDDPRQLGALALKTAEAIRKVPGVTGVRNGIKPAGDALVVHVDRVKAALEGVDPNRVTRMLNNIVTGQVTTQMQEGPKMVGVRVWVPGDLRQAAADLPRCCCAPRTGTSFRSRALPVSASKPASRKSRARTSSAWWLSPRASTAGTWAPPWPTCKKSSLRRTFYPLAPTSNWAACTSSSRSPFAAW
jgi:multidrug efflux pump subunit AcrB